MHVMTEYLKKSGRTIFFWILFLFLFLVRTKERDNKIVPRLSDIAVGSHRRPIEKSRTLSTLHYRGGRVGCVKDHDT